MTPSHPESTRPAQLTAVNSSLPPLLSGRATAWNAVNLCMVERWKAVLKVSQNCVDAFESTPHIAYRLSRGGGDQSVVSSLRR